MRTGVEEFEDLQWQSKQYPSSNIAGAYASGWICKDCKKEIPRSAGMYTNNNFDNVCKECYMKGIYNG